MIRSILLFEKGGQFIRVGEGRTAKVAAVKKVFTFKDNALIAGNSFFLSFFCNPEERFIHHNTDFNSQPTPFVSLE